LRWGRFRDSNSVRDWLNGDDGYDTALSPPAAKNVLTVGSITDINGIVGMQGTSFAAPNVTGGLILAEQRRMKPHPAASRLSLPSGSLRQSTRCSTTATPGRTT
jgi:hypothetical protein